MKSFAECGTMAAYLAETQSYGELPLGGSVCRKCQQRKRISYPQGWNEVTGGIRRTECGCGTIEELET